MTHAMISYQIISTSQTEERCNCSVKHIPNPMMLAKVDIVGEEVHLCPSGLFNLQNLLHEYDLTGGVPAGSVTKHYGKYLRDLALNIYHSRSTNDTSRGRWEDTV